jgi:hypothetical protein
VGVDGRFSGRIGGGGTSVAAARGELSTVFIEMVTCALGFSLEGIDIFLIPNPLTVCTWVELSG